MEEELQREIETVRAEFEGADERRLAALAPIIEQAACERIYLRTLNRQALISGLVQVHPDNPTRQRSLPISAEIARHAAALTTLTDKLIKHLIVGEDEDSGEMEDYE